MASAMTDRIPGLPTMPADPDASSGLAASHAPTGTPTVDFRSALRAGAESLSRGEAALDASIARLGRGGTLAPEELIALQATAYRHATEVELAAKLVDKLTGAVRTTLTSQQ